MAVGLAAVRPWAQKSMWKLVYGMASRVSPHPGTAFMNYGYAPLEPGAEAGGAAAGDRPDRFGIELYDRVASGWDLAGRDVLDVGCGRGGGAAFVVDRHGPRSLVGVDLLHGAVARCRVEHERAGLTFVQADAEALPFADAAFDAVLNVESSHCYPDVPRFLDEVHRVLRPGGVLLFADLRHADLAGRSDATVMPQPDVGQLLAELDRSPLTVIEQQDITANVLQALRLDSERRRRLIERRVPRLLQPQALAFAAVDGTPLYQGFVDGDVAYLRFVLRKAA
jgi:SAM-dependent methyltransferase